MQRARSGNGGHGRRWRPHGAAFGVRLALLAALLAAACAPGCRSAKSDDPAAIFRSIQSDFLHGNLDAAEQSVRKERRKLGVTAGRTTDWSLKFLLLDAEILTYQGRGRDVIALLTNVDAAQLKGDAAIKRHLLYGLALSGLRQIQSADEEVRAARELAQATHSTLVGEVLRTEAQLQINRNDLPAAMDLFRSSLAVARDQRDAYLEATDLLNMGFVSMNLAHYDEALAELDAAANFARSIGARTVTEAATGNLGWAYFNLGDFDKALANFLQAEQQAREIGTTSAQVDWLQDAGLAYYKLGNMEAAKKYDEQALQAALSLHASKDIVNIETNLAQLLRRQGQYDRAMDYSEAAIRAAHESGDDAAAVYPLFLQALLAARRTNGEDAERMLLQVHRDSAAEASLKWDVENGIAGFYFGRGETRKAELWYRRSIDTFDRQRSSVKDEALKLSFFANGDTLYRDYAEFLIASSRSDQALQLLDRGRARTLEEGLGLTVEEPHGRPAPAEDARSVARRVDGTILFYSLGPEKSWLWAIAANQARRFELPKQADIASLVQGYQKAILRSNDPLRDVNQAATALYDALIAPAAAMIPKDSKVFLIPDGVLNGLNFETLLAPTGSGFAYWIESVTVENASSIRLLSVRHEPVPQTAANNLLLIGNPLPTKDGYESLPNAPAEIDGVQRHFPRAQRTVITQARAVPAAYPANKPDQFSYIHFVAHGTASRLSPLDSAVVLSATPESPESFKLYARDIVQHRLHAKLVTISTCYGSGLRAYAGEGMVGLAWAFLRAGSHDVIGALWEANDASTPLLMDRLYGEIELGKSPAAALRDAKLSLIHSAGVYRKPLYWGAFQLYAGS